MNSNRIRLWDLPTRLFHWLLVATVVGAVVSGQIGGNLMPWHARLGFVAIGLIVFRLVWGFVGSTYARFCQFFPTPARIRAYLRGEWRSPGHNPLGAVSVFVLLTLVTLQAVTGLFANDDISFSGPFHDLIDEALAGRLTGLHHLGANLLIAFVVLHVAAILFYLHVKKDNLVQPMLTGWKEGHEGESARGGSFPALIVALALGVAAAYAASGACLPPPAEPPAVTTPSW